VVTPLVSARPWSIVQKREIPGDKAWLSRAQIGFYVAQILAKGQLREGHGAKLVGATEAVQPEIAIIPGHVAGQ